MIEGLRDFDTVQRWIENVNRYYNLTDREWVGRLQVLDEFCTDVRTTPDQIIAESLQDRGVKNEYMRRLKRFVRERHGEERAAHDAENVVRSFFIHNGARVFVRPYQS